MQYAAQLTIRNSLKICNSLRNGDFRLEVDRLGSFYSTYSAGRFSDLQVQVELRGLGLGFNLRFFFTPTCTLKNFNNLAPSEYVKIHILSLLPPNRQHFRLQLQR